MTWQKDSHAPKQLGTAFLIIISTRQRRLELGLWLTIKNDHRWTQFSMRCFRMITRLQYPEMTVRMRLSVALRVNRDASTKDTHTRLITWTW